MKKRQAFEGLTTEIQVEEVLKDKKNDEKIAMLGNRWVNFME